MTSSSLPQRPAPSNALKRFLGLLEGVKPCGSGYSARCPAHQDRNASLSVGQGDDGRVLAECHTGCTIEQVVRAVGLTTADLFERRNGQHRPRPGGEGAGTPHRLHTHAQTQTGAGLSLAQYGEAKRLPLDFLRELRLSDFSYLGQRAVREPYLGEDGTEAAVRFRLALEKGEHGDNRFVWRSGSKVQPYGLWRLPDARAAGRVTIVEGESDSQTLWLHGEPALGVPGADTFKAEWCAHVEGIPLVYVVIEPDSGGSALLRRLEEHGRPLHDRLRLVRLDGCKDPSALYLRDPDGFKAAWQAALASATAWADRAAAERQQRSQAAWAACADLARQPGILDRFATDLATHGVAGERRSAKVLYLVVNARHLDRLVSAAVKGPSAAGKSYLAERVLAFFPDSAYYALSAMSERALAYSDEPLSHRVLVIYEAAGLNGDFASYLLRSLLSEGRVRYETVEKTAEGMRPRLIEREGPTGLIVTTTAVSLHAENETRLLDIPVTDTRQQTALVLDAIARAEDAGRAPADLAPWHALQEWIAASGADVAVPYALPLAKLVPPVATRLRRDFPAVLALTKSHALLHQASRERDGQGRILAAVDDYAVVRDLLADLVAGKAGATVPATVRETVAAVAALLADKTREHVRVSDVAHAMKLDASTAWRRVQQAVEGGWLDNKEDKPRRPARLVLGEPLPGDTDVLPPVATLEARWKVCAIARSRGGIPGAPPQDDGERCPDCGSGLVMQLASDPTQDTYLCATCGYSRAVEVIEPSPTGGDAS